MVEERGRLGVVTEFYRLLATASGPGSTCRDLERLAEKCRFSARRLAGHLGISQRHLQRIFRVELHCAPRAWLRRERLLASRQMLESAATVKEVAFALGFRHESQFCRDFKAQFGHSPSLTLRSNRRLPTSVGN
jgi:transcriptional regulator GlxA family with amidase domain